MTTVPAEPVTQTVHGRTTIADRVIDRICGQVAADDPDVVSARANTRRSGQTAVIQVDLHLRYPVALAAATDRIRAQLTARTTELSGLIVSRVDISIAELVPDAKPERRVR